MAKTRQIKTVRGMRDLVFQDAGAHQVVVRSFLELAKRYGFSWIDTPVLESTDLFARGMGQSSDVVAKEMYSFTDRNGDSLSLRPEFTAGIIRAFLSGGWRQHLPLRMVAHGPLFRRERPQKGRYRQFYQINAEIIGVAEPQADVELIAMAWHLLEQLGLQKYVRLALNSLGDFDSRSKWRQAILDYFTPHRHALSDDSKRRLDENPLRILDSKDPGDQALAKDAPKITEFYTVEAGYFFDYVRKCLEALGIPYTHQPDLVRGLDYYCHTAFEFITDDLGAQGTVIGGGRYDGLVAQLGGPATPGVGWAGGIDRIALLLSEANKAATQEPAMQIEIIALGGGELKDAVQQAGLALTQRLRYAGYRVGVTGSGSLKKRLAKASNANVDLVLILGEEEMRNQMVQIKILKSGEQRLHRLDTIESAVAEILS